MWLVKFVFSFSFFVIMIIILLNVIFGIIIDTFAQMREEDKFTRENMENQCFICGIDRFTFDTASQSSGGFDAHIKRDHNVRLDPAGVVTESARSSPARRRQHIVLVRVACAMRRCGRTSI